MTDPCLQIDNLLEEFKEGKYLYGPGCLAELGEKIEHFGKRAMLVRVEFPGIEPIVERLKKSLSDSGIEIVRELVNPIRPNAPVEDMIAVSGEIAEAKPEMVISLGGGSTIDAVKSAIVLDVLGGEIEDYFGVGKVAEALAPKVLEIVNSAIETAKTLKQEGALQKEVPDGN